MLNVDSISRISRLGKGEKIFLYFYFLFIIIKDYLLFFMKIMEFYI